MLRRGRDRGRDATAHGEQRYLGELQAPIMEIAWARGRVTVHEVLAELRSERDLAYTTVMTVMARLAEQGILARERVGKTYFYRPAYSREQLQASISSAIVRDLIDDFGDVALTQFVDTLERTDPVRLARLRALLDEREAAKDDA